MTTTGSRLGGWRVALRLARREAWRRRSQTLLMLFLICMPVVAVTAAAIVWRTADLSGPESVERRMGAAAALISPVGTDVDQQFDPDDGSSWGGEARALTAGRIRAVIGDRPMIPLRTTSSDFQTAHGVADTGLLEVDLHDPLAAGLFRLEAGHLPRTSDEVVVNPALVERGPGIGDLLVLGRKTADGPQPRALRIVGVADYAGSRSFEWAGVLPGALPVTPDDGPAEWLVGGGPVTWGDVRKLNGIGALVASRQVISDPPPESALSPDLRGQVQPVSQETITVLALVVAMVLLEVVLLAGPAFAVRARAQAHTLALVAASGGTPAQARRTVLASGVVVGALGGLFGVAWGIVVAVLAVPIAQTVDASWFGPFEVPWAMVAVVAAFGFASAVLAAVVPAFAASRQDAVAVLAGRRGEGRPSRRSPVVGLALIGVGIAGSFAGSRPGGGSSPLLVGSAAIISVVGMIFLVPVAIATVARLSARLPLPLRFAARDAARHRTRTVPAIAAVGATVAGVVALGIAVSSQADHDEKTYQPMLQLGYGVVDVPTDATPADVAQIEQILTKGLPDAPRQRVTGVVTDTDDYSLMVSFAQDGAEIQTSYWGVLGTGYVVADALPAYLGVGDDSRVVADRALAGGGIVLLHSQVSSAVPSGGQVTVTVGETPPGGGEVKTRATAAFSMVAAEIPGRAQPAAAVLSPVAAKRLHLPTATTAIAVLPTIDGAAAQRVDEELAATASHASLSVERGFQPSAETRIIKLVLAVLGAILMLGGTLTATFLALSDARPDLATMAAVGARPRTRRGVAAAYALVVGLVGALLGAPIGFIPGVAISGPLTHDFQTGATSLVIPWTLLGAVVLGLPLLTALVVGACARSRLPLVARID
ncbi:hypothetical protein GCM10022237_34660 [Nocardioides ginsengisoli]|uniref:FtsX-like permease family protein n=1 Tax=Nocardioides ginsengisoli TaxID=363868 RepID=A0ABW3VX91_9ACTN